MNRLPPVFALRAFAFALTAFAAFAQTPHPFTLTWTEGRCIACRTAIELGHIEFINRTEAWAVGYNHGTRGPGNAIVVHTSDAGRTWHEIPESAQDGGTPAGPPAFWFLDAQRGWLSASLSSEDPITVTTFDSGGHWLDLGSRQLRQLRFFDETRGFAIEQAYLMRTRDGGEHWSEYGFPQIGDLDRMFFLTPDTGWIAGTDDRTVFVARTTDGARTFQQARIVSPVEIDSVQDLFFADPMRGWLILWNANGAGTKIFTTIDAGKIWTALRDPGLQGAHRWATAIRFLTPKDGYVFEKADDGDRTLFWTSDAGLHWTSEPLAHAVSDCQILEADLVCSGGEEPEGFSILTLHRAPL